MKIKTFLHYLLATDNRCNTILSLIRELNSKEDVDYLDLQMRSSFINYCNVYIPWLLLHTNNSNEELAKIIFNDVLKYYK